MNRVGIRAAGIMNYTEEKRLRQEAPAAIHLAKRYLPIQDYAVIGNLHTVALVGKNGSIDWCCLPRFDAPSVFGALLDANKGGFFRIAPLPLPGTEYKQLYLPDTNILITRFLTPNGVGEVTDFMPIKQTGNDANQHYLMRFVQAVNGSLTFEMVCRPAFNYARDAHTLHVLGKGAIFLGSNLCLALSSPLPLEEDSRGGVQVTFTLHQGQSMHFLFEGGCNENIRPFPSSLDHYEAEFLETKRYWQNWLTTCRYQGRWREMVHRSALVLKLLTYEPTGAIVAAPTTSLPETIGGARNWDYRYTWLRDAAFTIYGLLILGFVEEGRAFMNWLEARCRELPESGFLPPLFTITGEQNLIEVPLDHLEGYRRSRPVRIGNGAYTQQQLDIYGELMDSIYLLDRHKDISYDLWSNLRRLLDWLSTHWQNADEGIWEVRGERQHFVHSRVMSWVAFDRAVRIARHRGFPAPLHEWIQTSSQIFEEIMQKGWNDKVGSFVQCYGGEAVDATALLMVLTRFAAPDDPRMLATIDRIQKELSCDSHVYRYLPELAANDGFRSREGTFSLCSFWLVEALARGGRLEEARLILEKMFTYANHVGLYAEEIGPTGEALGNFPQALTHLSLISACYNLDRALNGKRHH
jgi:GH15 family glucan-1,4-alpha-glucosidase